MHAGTAVVIITSHHLDITRGTGDDLSHVPEELQDEWCSTELLRMSSQEQQGIVDVLGIRVDRVPDELLRGQQQKILLKGSPQPGDPCAYEHVLAALVAGSTQG